MPSEPRSQGLVGVVVIGRNEAQCLPACLRALGAYRDRLVYADSASTDNSREIARDNCAIVVALDESSRLTPARGRNEGFTTLLQHFPDCEFVQFVDGDSVVQPGWIEVGSEFLGANERAAVVCGHVEELHPEQSVYNWLCEDEWKGRLGRIDACGGNALMRVAAFRQLGGFRSELPAGEEAELMGRMRDRGWEIWRIDHLMVVHDADILSFGDWWRRTKRGGYSYANLWSLTRRCDKPLYLTQLRSSIIWVLAFPGSITACAWALGMPALMIAIPLLYVFQISRLAIRRGAGSVASWTYASMIMLAKVAETAGVIRYIQERLFGRLQMRAIGGLR